MMCLPSWPKPKGAMKKSDAHAIIRLRGGTINPLSKKEPPAME
jgi:hypothetical protein